jgi:hypothetical protein
VASLPGMELSLRTIYENVGHFAHLIFSRGLTDIYVPFVCRTEAHEMTPAPKNLCRTYSGKAPVLTRFESGRPESL